MAGIRAILAPPALPRITTRESSADDSESAPGRRLHSRAPEAAHPRSPAFNGEGAAAIRPAPLPASRPARPGIPFTVAEKLPTLSPVRASTPGAVIERIVDAVRLRACSGTRIRIALSPEHLGELLIELDLRGGVLHGRVVAETDGARDLIASQLDRLRDALDGQGIQLGDFQVSVDRPLPAPSPSFEPIEARDEPDAVRSVRRQLLDVLA